MRRREALELLGITAAQASDRAALRSAYRARMRVVHPDRNPAPEAAALAGRISAAYRVLTTEPATGPGSRTGDPRTGDPRPPRGWTGPATGDAGRPPPRRVRARVVDADTVAIDGSRQEAFAAVLEASHRLGDIGYLDPAAGMVEVVVEFTDAPTSSLVMTLQGRSSGSVEVFCTLEPLSGGQSPPLEAVTRLLARTLSGIPVDELAL